MFLSNTHLSLTPSAIGPPKDTACCDDPHAAQRSPKIRNCRSVDRWVWVGGGGGGVGDGDWERQRATNRCVRQEIEVEQFLFVGDKTSERRPRSSVMSVAQRAVVQR